MKKTKLFITMFIGLIISVILSATALGADPIKLGVSTSLTGPAAGYGIHIKNGAEMAVEETNKNGGINGRLIKLIVGDNRGDPTEGVAVINRLITKDQVDALVGGNMSSLVLAHMSIAEKEGVPYIVVGASNPAITRPGNEFTFRLHQSDATAAKQAAEFVVNKMKKTKITVMHDTNDYGTGCKDHFVKALKAMGIEPLTIQGYNTGEKDFSVQVLKIRETKPEFLGLFGVLPEVSMITKQIRDLGMQDLGIIMTGISQPKYIELAPEDSEGVLAVTPFNSAMKCQEAHDVAAKYIKIFNMDPPHQVTNTYQAIKYVYAPVWEEVGTDKVKVRNAIRKHNWNAFCSENYFDENHQVIMDSVVIEVKDQSWKVYE